MPYGVDWEAVIVDLRREGVHYRAIGRLLGVSESTVHAWACNDREPRHVDGEQLIALWMYMARERRANLPVHETFPSAAKA